MQNLDSNYWQERYQKNQTGWDLGQASQPIVSYIQQLNDKSLKILIPGCGNAYEAEYLWKNGFENVYVADFAKLALQNFNDRVSEFPKNQLLETDIFEINDTFDLIIEQTLFCAIDPVLRQNYIKKMAELLTENGKYVGLLFNRDFENGPPFGGSKSEYIEYMSPHFKEISMDNCYNSIEPRSGSELFFIAKK